MRFWSYKNMYSTCINKILRCRRYFRLEINLLRGWAMKLQGTDTGSFPYPNTTCQYGQICRRGYKTARC